MPDTDATRWYASLPVHPAAINVTGARKVANNGRASRWRVPDGSEVAVAKRWPLLPGSATRAVLRFEFTFYSPGDRVNPTHRYGGA